MSRYKRQIVQLEQQLSGLAQQLHDEKTKHSSLQAQSSILASWLASLHLLLLHQHPHQPNGADQQVQEECYEDLKQQLELLMGSATPAAADLLASSCSQKSDQVSAQEGQEAQDSYDPLLETIGSAQDPMAYFR